MLSLLVVVVVSFLVSALTLFSGFGLGTLLMPVYALIFPVEWAIAATAVVHLANNLFKLVLVGGEADKAVILRFSAAAIPMALIGSLLLEALSHAGVLARYEAMGYSHQVTWLKLVMAAIMAYFAWTELSETGTKKKFSGQLMWGGALSGFFGGLSGHQGAFRSAVLSRSGLDKEAFIGTGVVCAVLIDTVRLLVYGWSFHTDFWASASASRGLLSGAIGAAFLGSFMGARWIKKVSLPFIQRFVGVLLFLIAGLLAAGWV